MGTLYLRMPADELIDDAASDPSAMLDDDNTTAWISPLPMLPGEAIVIDRGDYRGGGRYESMIDGDATTKWSSAINMVPGQAVIIDRGDPVKGIGDPANMIDGDSTTYWTSGANMKPGMAVIIDRGAGFLSKLFNQVVMQSGTHTEDYARAFTVSVSDDKTTWTQISSGFGASPTIVSLKFPSRLERYVKITQTGTAAHWWTLTELRLKYNTGVLHDVDPSNWQLSIGGITANLPLFNRLVMNSGSAVDDYARTFTVAVSDNKTSWTTVASGFGATPLISIAFENQRERYIKITQTGTAPHPWTLAEVDVRNVGTILDRSAWVLDATGSVGGLPQFNEIFMDSGTSLDGYARTFAVYVSADSNTWTQVTFGVGAPVVTSPQFPVQTARYIKIVQTSVSPHTWTLASLTARLNGVTLNRDAWDVSVPGRAAAHPSDYWLALSVNAAGPALSDPANAIDDNPASIWTTDGPATTGQTLTINRGSSRSAFNTVVVDFGASLSGHTGFDYVTGQPGTRFQILVSDDAVSWTWQATVFAFGQTLTVPLSAPQVSQYIQLVIMDPLNAPWTVSNINLFSGEFIVSRFGWTLSTANVGGGRVDGSGLLRLNTKLGWHQHVPPAAADAHPLKLKMKDKSWRTVMYLGQPDGMAAPFMATYSRMRNYDELAGTHSDFVQNYRLPDYDVDVGFGSQSYMLQADTQRTDTWIRELVAGRPTGRQIRTSKTHLYMNSTVWVTSMDYVRLYWAGYPVTKLRFGFQIQEYTWDTRNMVPGTPRGTVRLYRHSTPLPTYGQPALPGTGTPIHTFAPVVGDGYPDVRAVYRSRADVPLKRGEMFWYEIDPVWQDIAFSLCTSWEADGVTIPVTEPGTSAPDLPELADGFYQYRGEEYTFVKVVFQVVTG